MRGTAVFLRPGTVIRQGVVFESQKRGRRGRSTVIARFGGNVLVGKNGRWQRGANRPKPGEEVPVRIIGPAKPGSRKFICEYAG